MPRNADKKADLVLKHLAIRRETREGAKKNKQNMSDAVYSEINFHITWHTKNSLPMIRERIESRLYQYLTHRILDTPEVRLHAVGGIETHVHIGLSAPPNLLISDYIGKLKGSSSHYINHEVEPKALQWQRGYGIVTFGTKDLQWVIDYITNQKEHHRRGATYERLERFTNDDTPEGTNPSMKDVGTPW